MAGFSIDEVRDSFEADISGFLSRIEATGNELLASAALSSPDPPGSRGFASLGDFFHSLYGTSMLVGARSLAETAGRLERLSEAGLATLQKIESQQQEVRELARVCLAGATEMRGMLQLELAHDAEQAKRLAQEFERNSLRSSSRPSRGHPENGEFDFPKAPLTMPAPPGIEEELLIVFREEARDAAAHARGHLEALRANASDVSALGALERLYHKLKGAAAGVGWSALSERAAALQARLEAVLEGTEEFSASGGLPRLSADTSALLVDAGLPPLELDGVAAPAEDEEISFGDTSAEHRATGSAEDSKTKLAELFRQELAGCARALRDQFGALLAQPEDAAAAREVEKILLSLKGAAASAGLDELSQRAASLQADAESLAERSVKATEDLVRGMAQRTHLLFARAGLDPSALLRRGSDPGEGGLARELFSAEARQIIGRATTVLAELKGANHWRSPELLGELARLFHHLKGSALVSKEEKVAALGGQLQTLCESADVQSRLPELNALVEQLAAQLRALGGAEKAPTSAQFPTLRENVEVMSDPTLWEAFSQECMDLLEQLDTSILALDTTDNPTRVLQAAFRLYHTLKGTVGTIGLEPVARSLHAVEDYLEAALESNRLPAPRSLQSFLLSIQADIRRQLAQCRKGFVETSPERVRAAIASLNAGAALARSVSISVGDGYGRKTGASGDSRDQSADDEAAPAMRQQIRVAAERLDQLMDLAGELVVSRSRLMTRVDILQALQRELGRNNERLLGAVESFCDKYEFTSIAGPRTKGALPAAAVDVMREGATWGAFSELELDRYDDVNVLSRSLTEISDDINDVSAGIVNEIASFADDSDAFGALVSGIQNEVTRTRMVALGSTFRRLTILARDAADQAEKEIRVELVGEDVSLDKAVADALFAPMLHLVRNAVAHGIEPASAREAAGKPRVGVIVLSAREDAGQIVVEVRDDGNGLDLDALHRRGVELGLIDRSVPPTDPRVKELVFQSGITTQKHVGRISGRGIGCDVVQRAVERLNGSIVVTSKAKQGTSFVLSLPITLAITKALLVRNAGRVVAVPLYFSERIIDADELPAASAGGVQRVELDGVFTRLHSLAELFGKSAENPAGPRLVLRLGRRRCVLQVDGVIDQEEIVVKSPGGLLSGHPLLAGVSVRGSGDLVLVLDVPALIEATAPVADALDFEAAGQAAPDSEGAAGLPPRLAAVPQVSGGLSVATARRLTGDVRIQPHVRALFVDDSLSVRKVAERTLRGLGVEVILAGDGVDALAKLRENEVDIVFTDLEMPRMHGYDLIRELRFGAAYKNLPIVVVSSRSGNKHKQQATELGATDYLIKPFSPEIIREALVRHCGFGNNPLPPTHLIVKTP